MGPPGHHHGQSLRLRHAWEFRADAAWPGESPGLDADFAVIGSSIQRRHPPAPPGAGAEVADHRTPLRPAGRCPSDGGISAALQRPLSLPSARHATNSAPPLNPHAATGDRTFGGMVRRSPRLTDLALQQPARRLFPDTHWLQVKTLIAGILAPLTFPLIIHLQRRHHLFELVRAGVVGPGLLVASAASISARLITAEEQGGQAGQAAGVGLPLRPHSKRLGTSPSLHTSL